MDNMMEILQQVILHLLKKYTSRLNYQSLIICPNIIIVLQRTKEQMKEQDIEGYLRNKNELIMGESNTKACQKLVLTSIEHPLKFLLHRNRSLMSLFESNSSNLHILREQKYRNSRLKANNQSVIKEIANGNTNIINKYKQDSKSKDQYLLSFKKQNQNSFKQKMKQFSKKEEIRRSKAIIKQKNRISVYQQFYRNPSTKFYDPQTYNWRKSLKKQRVQTTVQDELSSAAYSKMVFSEYYDANNQQSRKGNPLGNCKEQNKTNSLQQRRSKRCNSLTSRPKVVHNVFDLRSPKAKCFNFSPQNILQFTFGL